VSRPLSRRVKTKSIQTSTQAHKENKVTKKKANCSARGASKTAVKLDFWISLPLGTVALNA